ncbi:MAG: glycosyltransferase family 2 protein, partial [Sedimentisphaerales bacterium]
MDVSIVIVNWNTKDLLRDCLKSIGENTREVDYEIVVVDNNSTDGSAQMVKDEFEHVLLISNSENRGFAAANNQAVKIAKGRYILLLNSDTIVLDQAIEKTVVFADKHPDTAVTGCRVLNPDGTLQKTCFMFPSILNMFLAGIYLYKLFPKST